MRLFKLIFALILMMSYSVVGQDKDAAMGAPKATEAKDIIVKWNKETGKIELFDATNNKSITQQYQLDILELEIFDSNGEYAGSLEVKDFSIPKNEVDKTEKVKVTNMRFKHTASGEQMTLSNVDFAR